MDPELTKGFQELQAQVYESRSKIASIETCQKLTTHDAKINDTLLGEFEKCDDIEKKYFYQPVGRMLVKQEGKKAHEFLLERKNQYQERLKQYQEIKEVCVNRVKESENSLRELVNKKLNKNNNTNSTNNENEGAQGKPEAT
jgi:chaperonin cofactor prefoldin